MQLAVDAAEGDRQLLTAACNSLLQLGKVPSFLLPLFLCVVEGPAQDSQPEALRPGAQAQLERLLLTVLTLRMFGPMKR